MNAALRRLVLGWVAGGGTWLDRSACDIDVRVSDPVAGLAAIREVLRSLVAPPSTWIVGEAGKFSVSPAA